jgi:hypothetical protein
MAAAISPADRTLNLVISISPLGIEAKHLASALEMRGATGGLNEILVQSRSPLRDFGGGNDHNFRPAIATRRGALTRHWRLNLNSRYPKRVQRRRSQPSLSADRWVTELPRSRHRHFLIERLCDQLFQQVNGLSPTSQFSPSGGAGGTPRTRGTGMPIPPSL